jgi:hypothetical protein
MGINMIGMQKIVAKRFSQKARYQIGISLVPWLKFWNSKFPNPDFPADMRPNPANPNFFNNPGSSGTNPIFFKTENRFQKKIP